MQYWIRRSNYSRSSADVSSIDNEFGNWKGNYLIFSVSPPWQKKRIKGNTGGLTGDLHYTLIGYFRRRRSRTGTEKSASGWVKKGYLSRCCCLIGQRNGELPFSTSKGRRVSPHLIDLTSIIFVPTGCLVVGWWKRLKGSTRKLPIKSYDNQASFFRLLSFSCLVDLFSARAEIAIPSSSSYYCAKGHGILFGTPWAPPPWKIVMSIINLIRSLWCWWIPFSACLCSFASLPIIAILHWFRSSVQIKCHRSHLFCITPSFKVHARIKLTFGIAYSSLRIYFAHRIAPQRKWNLR